MDKEKLIHQLFIGKVCEVIGDSQTLDLLKECREVFEQEIKPDFEFDAEIEEKSFTAFNNHGRVKLYLPYSYDVIEKLIIGGKVKVKITYKTK